MITARIRAFFRAIYRTPRSFWLQKNYQRFELNGPGFFIRVPRPTFELVCSYIDSAQAMKLSLAEARVLFRSTKFACERRNIETVKVGDLSWTIDARLQSRNPEEIVIKYRGPLGTGTMLPRLDNVISACDQFAEIFDQTLSTLVKEENG